MLHGERTSKPIALGIGDPPPIDHWKLKRSQMKNTGKEIRPAPEVGQGLIHEVLGGLVRGSVPAQSPLSLETLHVRFQRFSFNHRRARSVQSRSAQGKGVEIFIGRPCLPTKPALLVRSEFESRSPCGSL